MAAGVTMRTTLRLSLSRYGRSYATSQPRTPSSSSRPSARATVAQPSSVPVSRKTVRPVTPSSIDNTKPLRAERADTANEGNSKSLFQSYTSLSYSNKLRIWFGIVAFTAAGLMVADRFGPRSDAHYAAIFDSDVGSSGAKFIDHKQAEQQAATPEPKPKLFGITVVDRK